MAKPSRIAQPDRKGDRARAVAWAQDLHRRTDWILLDTETTGLELTDQIIQVGVMDCSGKPILDNVLIRPTIPIPPKSTTFHHITNAMVKNAPGFDVVWPAIKELLTGYEVVIYNAAFDTRQITQTAKLHGIKVPPYRYSCAMLNYAAFLGEWNDYRQSYNWPKLTGGDHSATGDCRATLEVLRKMWNTRE